MILYVNDKNEIKDVNTTDNDTLIPLEIDDNNPFTGWSVAKICCYKVKVVGRRVSVITPYVSTHIIEHIDRLSTQNMSAQAQIDYIAMMTDVEM